MGRSNFRFADFLKWHYSSFNSCCSKKISFQGTFHSIRPLTTKRPTMLKPSWKTTGAILAGVLALSRSARLPRGFLPPLVAGAPLLEAHYSTFLPPSLLESVTSVHPEVVDMDLSFLETTSKTLDPMSIAQGNNSSIIGDTASQQSREGKRTISSGPAAGVVWDLSEFGWKGYADPKLKVFIDDVIKEATEFNKKYAGKLADNFVSSVEELSRISGIKSKVELYLSLLYTTDQNNTDLTKVISFFNSRLDEAWADYLSFYANEVNSLSDEFIDEQIKSSEYLQKNKLAVEQIRKARPHTLSTEVERALALRESWASPGDATLYYNKQLGLLSFEVDGKTIGVSEATMFLQSPSALIRRKYMNLLNREFVDTKLNEFAALSLNMVAGKMHIENVERKYGDEIRARKNIHNLVSDAVVSKLIHAVRTEGVRLSKRYFSLKRRILINLGAIKEFTWAERLAPYPRTTPEKEYSWDEAVNIVADSYGQFSDQFRTLFLEQVDKKRIHAQLQLGKATGAFCTAARSPDFGPYEMVNFVGKSNDIITLAHESGHAIHYVLSRKQDPLVYSTPLALAEVASLFGEMLTFRKLLEKSKTDEDRIALMFERMDGIMSTITRQIAFDRFEELFHTQRAEGMLSSDDFSNLWMQVTREFYGDAGEVFDNYKDMENLWVAVGHFHSSPFYVYAYAFAELMVGALSSDYVKNPDQFVPKYVTLLEAAGSQMLVDVFQPFGLNLEAPEFWIDSVKSSLGGLIERIEEQVEKMGM